MAKHKPDDSGAPAPDAQPHQTQTDAPSARDQEAKTSPSVGDGRTEENQEPSFIVGIGASAGGLDACKRLFGALAEPTGMAFVLVQHLDRKHESQLSEILARDTWMGVQEVRDGMRAAPDQIYIIPPNTDLAILHGTLSLMPRTDVPGAFRPIDNFLACLARDQKERAIGVILSGTGSDGAQGIRAVKAEGGITIAEADASAAYRDMPQSAVATGCVDMVLPAEEIAQKNPGHRAASGSPASCGRKRTPAGGRG